MYTRNSEAAWTIRRTRSIGCPVSVPFASALCKAPPSARVRASCMHAARSQEKRGAAAMHPAYIPEHPALFFILQTRHDTYVRVHAGSSTPRREASSRLRPMGGVASRPTRRTEGPGEPCAGQSRALGLEVWAPRCLAAACPDEQCASWRGGPRWPTGARRPACPLGNEMPTGGLASPPPPAPHWAPSHSLRPERCSTESPLLWSRKRQGRGPWLSRRRGWVHNPSGWEREWGRLHLRVVSQCVASGTRNPVLRRRPTQPCGEDHGWCLLPTATMAVVPARCCLGSPHPALHVAS
jgi:hypothetical protein